MWLGECRDVEFVRVKGGRAILRREWNVQNRAPERIGGHDIIIGPQRTDDVVIRD